MALFKVSGEEETITPIWNLPVHEDSSIPALFLAWTPQDWFTEGKADGFAVTFSDGQTTVFGTTNGDITKHEKITEVGTFKAREMIEVWFVAMDVYPKSPFLFTGDDFGSLHTRRFTLESSDANHGDDDEDGQSILPSILQDHDDRAQHHTAGVTSILPLPLPLFGDAPILVTGSYDEYVRVYHATRKGAVLAELCLGGGVWRLLGLNVENTTLLSGSGPQEWRILVLASCMHGGTRVVRITGDGQSQWNIEIVAEFTEHESMNYASDVWKGDQRGKASELLCLSSSFYDRRVCLWRVNA